MRRDAAAVTTAASAAAFMLGAAVGFRHASRVRGRSRHSAHTHSQKPAANELDLFAEDAAAAAAAAATSTAGSTGTAPNALDCPVCLSELVLPRFAPCGHTLCSACLIALFEHERRPACPCCRKRIKQPVERLPENFVAKACVEARVSARGARALEAYRLAEASARLALSPYEDPGGGNAGSGGGGSGGSGNAGNGARGGTQQQQTQQQQQNQQLQQNQQRGSLMEQLRPAWNWFKWTAIIVTEFGAFLVSLKEVLEATPSRTRRYQRIV